MHDDLDSVREVAQQLADFLSEPQNGRDGKDGRDGRDGVDGKDGERGPKGDAGKDGRDGRDGLNAAPAKPASYRFTIARDEYGVMTEVIVKPL